MGMTEEMMNDTLDDLLTESGDEEEQDAIVNQVKRVCNLDAVPQPHWYSNYKLYSKLLYSHSLEYLLQGGLFVLEPPKN